MLNHSQKKEAVAAILAAMDERLFEFVAGNTGADEEGDRKRYMGRAGWFLDLAHTFGLAVATHADEPVEAQKFDGSAADYWRVYASCCHGMIAVAERAHENLQGQRLEAQKDGAWFVLERLRQEHARVKNVAENYAERKKEFGDDRV